MKKNQFINLLKWIGILPVVITCYIGVKLLHDWSFTFYYPGILNDVLTSNGFEGHNVLGPLLVFTREMIAVGVAIYCGTYLAPSNKMKVFYVLLGFWIIYLLIAVLGIGASIGSYSFSMEMIVRIMLETFGQLTGIIAVGYQLSLDDKLHK